MEDLFHLFIIILAYICGWAARDSLEDKMPFKSKLQQRWGNSPAGHEALGDAGVKEWNAATKGKELPEKVEKPKIGLQTLINKNKGR